MLCTATKLFNKYSFVFYDLASSVMKVMLADHLWAAGDSGATGATGAHS